MSEWDDFRDMGASTPTQAEHRYAEGTLERLKHDVFTRDLLITHLEAQVAALHQQIQDMKNEKLGEDPS